MDTLVSCHLHVEKIRASIIVPRFQHRLQLVKEWQLPRGSRYLDIGCGQGESCLVLSQHNGEAGSVTGVDTAPLTYGTPYNLEQSHKFVLASKLGSKIEFSHDNVADVTQRRGSNAFDAAVLCHSLWYFPELESIAKMFRDLAAVKISRLYVADYSYEASLPEQDPHVLASQAQALLHRYRRPRGLGDRDPNVRVAPSPDEVRELAKRNGWMLSREGRLTPAGSMREGLYEVAVVQTPEFSHTVRAEELEMEHEDQILSFVSKCADAQREVQSRGVQLRTMDVWWAVFDLDS